MTKLVEITLLHNNQDTCQEMSAPSRSNGSATSTNQFESTLLNKNQDTRLAKTPPSRSSGSATSSVSAVDVRKNKRERESITPTDEIPVISIWFSFWQLIIKKRTPKFFEMRKNTLPEEFVGKWIVVHCPKSAHWLEVMTAGRDAFPDQISEEEIEVQDSIKKTTGHLCGVIKFAASIQIQDAVKFQKDNHNDI